jgi:hypothetical protein
MPSVAHPVDPAFPLQIAASTSVDRRRGVSTVGQPHPWSRAIGHLAEAGPRRLAPGGHSLRRYDNDETNSLPEGCRSSTAGLEAEGAEGVEDAEGAGVTGAGSVASAEMCVTCADDAALVAEIRTLMRFASQSRTVWVVPAATPVGRPQCQLSFVAIGTGKR